MSKAETGSFWSELFTANLYKRSQGRLARQLTAAGLGAVVLIGAYVLSQGPLSTLSQPIKVGVPTVIVALSGWVIFRLVNYPVFAEFLISVEGEMNKVSWASKQEVYRATVVVLGTMFFLAAVLFAYDSFWYWVLSLAGVLRT
jgi:preprotein translocase subunit SecE